MSSQLVVPKATPDEGLVAVFADLRLRLKPILRDTNAGGPS